MARHQVAELGDVPPGTLRRVAVSGRDLCLAHVPDVGLFAIDDVCTHEHALLSDGELIGCEVECPEHFSRFDLRTGKVHSLPAMDDTRTYDVVVEGSDILVEIPESNAETS